MAIARRHVELFDQIADLAHNAFGLGGVIEGWREGLQLMRPGAVYRFVIPPSLGYGEKGSPPRVPANATMIFHVELVEVLDPGAR